MAINKRIIGSLYEKQSDYKRAIKNYNYALKISTEANDSIVMANCFNSIGVAYWWQGNYALALENLVKSAEMEERLNDQLGLADVYNNIGLIHKHMGNTSLAIEYFKKAIKVEKEFGDKRSITPVYSNLANIYADQGNDSLAIKYYFEALEINKEAGDSAAMAIDYMNIGIVYSEQVRYKLALRYLKLALPIMEKSNNKTRLATLYGNMGDVYGKAGFKTLAFKYFDLALTISKEQENKVGMKGGYLRLSDYFKNTKDYEQAYEYYLLYHQLNDSLFNDLKQKTVLELEAKYQNEKSKREIAELENKEAAALEIAEKRRLWLLLIGGLLLGGGLLMFLYMRQRSAQEHLQRAVLEQKSLRSQMNPHFISNSLIAIQSFIYKEAPKEAGKYLANFSKLMRLILENSREEYVLLEKEIQTMEYYLELQALRFENKFSHSINVDAAIDAETLAIPPMLAQPFIENALEHGISTKTTRGEINVRFKLEDDLIILEVEDNGIGRQKSAKLQLTGKNPHSSLSTTITEERLAILNKRNRQKIKLEMTDLMSPDNTVIGTKATFHIPYRYQ